MKRHSHSDSSLSESLPVVKRVGSGRRAALMTLLPLLSLPVEASCSHESEPELSQVVSNVISDANVDLDVAAPGSYVVLSGDYVMPASIDPLVVAQHPTDVRGQLYVPKGSGPFPLVVFLHGNHGTCGKVWKAGEPRVDNESLLTNGKCPGGYDEVRNHLGYDYLAQHLASHGYVVASINANQGVTSRAPDASEQGTDPGLILARGRLVLKHLAQLHKWNQGQKVPGSSLDLRGKVDFDHVGLMGHSRGGEGVRAAYQLYQEYWHPASMPASATANTYAKHIPKLNVEGVFEFAPVDGAVPSQTFDVPGVNWTVVIASCDKDVSDFQGTGTFRRRRESVAGSHAFSSVFVVPGANHNYFNTEWQKSDAADGCDLDQDPLWDSKGKPVGLKTQQDVGVRTLSSFFRGFVGSDPQRDKFQKVFDPQYAVPRQISDLIDPAREAIVREAVELAETLPPNASTGLGVDYHETLVNGSTGGARRDLTRIDWDNSTASPRYEALWSVPRNLPGTTILSFAVAPYQSCDRAAQSCQNGDEAIDFDVQLMLADGTTSGPVHLRDYVSMTNNLNRIDPCSAPFVQAKFGAYCEAEQIRNWSECEKLGGDRLVSAWHGMNVLAIFTHRDMTCVKVRKLPNACSSPFTQYDENGTSYCSANLPDWQQCKSDGGDPELSFYPEILSDRCQQSVPLGSSCDSGFVRVPDSPSCVSRQFPTLGDCERAGGDGTQSRYLACRKPEQPGFLLFRDVPIELRDFPGVDLLKHQVKGVRLTFDKTRPGGMFLDRTFVLRSTVKGTGGGVSP